MTTTISTKLESFSTNRLLQVVCFLYAVVWVIYAINPAWRPQWWLDNYLVFGCVALLMLSYKKYPLSDLSYILLAIFLSLHSYGANYGYSSTPIGFWLHDIFHHVRANPYDRYVHFLFGFLFSYPLQEVLVRYTRISSFWCYVFPVEFILSYSAFYEIIEAATAWTLPPDQYDPFIGLQGDIWDGYRDMSCALGGALLTMLLLALWRLVRKHSLR